MGFTGGPWEAEERVGGWSIDGDVHIAFVKHWHDDFASEMKANIELIRQAPNLHRLLVHMYIVHSESGCEDCTEVRTLLETMAGPKREFKH